MLFRSISLLALAVCLLNAAATRLAADQLETVVAATSPRDAAWTPPPQPPIPGPGWFADDPAQYVDPQDGVGPLTPGDGWSASYPFKFMPQGHRPSPAPDYESCLLSPEQSDLCYLTTPPTYFGTLYFDVMVLARGSSLESTDLVFDNGGTPLWNTGSLSLNTEASVRAGFVISHPTGVDLTGEYFGVHQFEDSATVGAAGGVQAVLFGQTTPAPNQVVVQFDSSLDSAELSLRARQTRRFAPLVGVRYIQVDEHFNVLQENVNGTGTRSQAINQLFGFQFGLQALICEYGPWRMDTILKAGPFYNDVDLSITPDPSGNAAATTKQLDYSYTSFMGEARVGLVRRLGRRMNFRIGYQALWLSGVAVAPNQINNISFATDLESVDLNDIVYQGGYLGLDLSW